MAKWIRVAFATCLCLMTNTGANADDEPLFEELKRRTRSEVFRLGALIQVVGTYQDNPPVIQNGFGLANFRLSVQGRLDEGWSYFFQTSFIKPAAILDASLGYDPAPLAKFRLGAFKTPFSGEFLTGAAAIDFINRAQAATVLAPGRQIGAQVNGESGTGVGYSLGAFNGNGLSIVNDNNELMTVGRVYYNHGEDEGGLRLRAGINAYHSRDENAPIGVPITGDFAAEGFAGERVAGGADFRLTGGRWLTSAEVIAARFDPRGGRRVEPYGYQVSAGFSPNSRIQLLARWDSIRLDGVARDSDIVVLGANYFPTAPTEVQLNVFVPTMEGDDIQVAANVQVAF